MLSSLSTSNHVRIPCKTSSKYVRCYLLYQLPTTLSSLVRLRATTLLSFLSTSNYVSDACDWQNPWHRLTKPWRRKQDRFHVPKPWPHCHFVKWHQKLSTFLGRAIFLFFYHSRLCFFFGSWFYAFLLLCFSASLLFCFLASLLFFLLFAFPASLLFMLLCFTCFFSFLLLCFPCFSAALFFCFCASVPFYFYYSAFSFLQSCVFAALLPAPLLLCFLSLLPLCFFFFSFALFSPVCILNETLKTLGETQRNPKEILIRIPDKKPLHETLNEPQRNHKLYNPKETMNETLKNLWMNP